MRIERHLPAISAELHAIASRHAPCEACGILTAAGVVIEMPNQAEEKDRTFDLGPLHELESSPGGIAAIWHTHPADEPPSTIDRWTCTATDVPWIVAGPTKLWVLYPAPLPLEGRDFIYGEEDCWAIVSDWYAQEYKRFFPWFDRPADGWWKEPGVSPYVEAADRFGFDLPSLTERGFGDVKEGDVLLMQVIGRRENHVAVYLGGGRVLHHMYGQLSRIDILDHRLQRFTTNICRLK